MKPPDNTLLTINRGWVRAMLYIPVYLFFIFALNFFLPASGESLSEQMILNAVFHYMMIFGLVWLFTWYLEKRNFRINGVRFSRKYFIYGIFSGAFFLLLTLSFLFIFNRIGLNAGTMDIVVIGKGALFFLLIAIGEELIFRGYILRNLLTSTKKIPAIIISSVAFSLFHLFNPSLTVTALVNIFFTGILLGIMYLKTKNIWMPTGFHFAWNFLQGPVFSIPVSGIQFNGLIKTNFTGPSFLHGGEFGLEGSVLLTVIFFSFILIYYGFPRIAKMGSGDQSDSAME